MSFSSLQQQYRFLLGKMTGKKHKVTVVGSGNWYSSLLCSFIYDL
jgi:hypothetical protein